MPFLMHYLDLKYLNSRGMINWNQTIKSPMALQNITIEKIQFSKDEPIFVLCNYAYEPPNSLLGEDKSLINNKYVIWAYDRDSKFLKEFEIRLKSKWVNGVEIALNQQGQLILSGFFNETRYNSVAGAFSLLLDNNLDIVNSSYYKFEDAILHKFIEEKDRGKTKDLEEFHPSSWMQMGHEILFLWFQRMVMMSVYYHPVTRCTVH